jgi:hypothetical protein
VSRAGPLAVPARAQGPAGLPELDFLVGAQALAPATMAAMSRLVQVERATELPGVLSSTVHVPRPVDLELAEVLIHLSGRPRLSRGQTEMAASTAPSSSSRSSPCSAAPRSTR